MLIILICLNLILQANKNYWSLVTKNGANIAHIQELIILGSIFLTI